MTRRDAADSQLPVIAFVDACNAPSRAVAARIGLSDHGARITPLDRVPRHAYADRPLDDASYPRA